MSFRTNRKQIGIPDFMFHASLKAAEDSSEESRTIEGYASTKDLDRYEEVVQPSAFQSSLDTYLQNPVLFYNHNWMLPIGSVQEARIDPKGLYVKAKINKTTEMANTVWDLVKEGDLRAFSFGFRVLDEEKPDDEDEDERSVKDNKKRKGPRRTIKDLDLMEVSVVSVPANARALFSVAKGLVYGNDLIERVLSPFDLLEVEKKFSLDLNVPRWNRPAKEGMQGEIKIFPEFNDLVKQFVELSAKMETFGAGFNLVAKDVVERIEKIEKALAAKDVPEPVKEEESKEDVEGLAGAVEELSSLMSSIS